MSPSPSVTSPFVSTAARICPSSWHRNSSKRRPPSLGGTAYPCVSSNRCAAPWRVRPIRYPWKSALEQFLLDVNRNCHGGFPRSRKSDSSAPSTRTEGSHGEGVLERLAGACGCDGRGGREPAGGRASAQPCTLHSGALARSVV